MYIKNNLDSFIINENAYSNNIINNIIKLYKSNISLNIISNNPNNNLLILENILHKIFITLENDKINIENTNIENTNIENTNIENINIANTNTIIEFKQLSKFHMINVNSKMETYLNTNLKYNGKKENTELNLFQLNYTDISETISNIKLILIDFKKFKFTEQKYYFLILEYLFNLNHLEETKYKLILLNFDIILNEFISKIKVFIEKYNVQLITINKYKITSCKGLISNLNLKFCKDKIIKYYLDIFYNNYKIIKVGIFNIFINVLLFFNLDIIKINILYNEFITYCIRTKLIKNITKTNKTNKTKHITNILLTNEISNYEVNFINYLVQDKEPKFISLNLCYKLLELITLNIIIDYLIYDNNTNLDNTNYINLSSLQIKKLLKIYYFNIEKLKSLLLVSSVFNHSFEIYIYLLQSIITWYIKLINNNLQCNKNNIPSKNLKTYLDIILLNNNDNSYNYVKNIFIDFENNIITNDKLKNDKNYLNTISNILITLTSKLTNKYEHIYNTKYFESNNKNIENKFNLFYNLIINTLLF